MPPRNAKVYPVPIMSELRLSTRQAEGELETLDSDEELLDYLDELAPHIGWIVIYFNSLEDTVSQCIREVILHAHVKTAICILRLDRPISDYSDISLFCAIRG